MVKYLDFVPTRTGLPCQPSKVGDFTENPFSGREGVARWQQHAAACTGCRGVQRQRHAVAECGAVWCGGGVRRRTAAETDYGSGGLQWRHLAVCSSSS